jgi:hypothetical protein
MSAKERDAILSDARAPVLNAVLNAPAFLSGITEQQQARMQKDALESLHADDWKQQEAEGAALKELQNTVRNALRTLEAAA